MSIDDNFCSFSVSSAFSMSDNYFSFSLPRAVPNVQRAVALVGIVIIFVYYCLLHKRGSSETNSSDPSLQVGRNVELSLSGGVSFGSDIQGARCFALEELNLATKNFSEINLIGFGTFGGVYKGLLQDGMIVAIKRRVAAPSRDFTEEVRYLSSIRHRNLVSLLGYCQEENLQMLIYDYIPNGTVSTHLYGTGPASSERFEFKHRLSIAHGAAKGLGHLHSLNPPLIHRNFKTVNCHVDEDFIPKVGDAGLRSLLARIDGSASSSRILTDDIFVDPQVKESGRFSVKSDVYSFGVFLLELVSGREAKSDPSIIEWAQNYRESSKISTVVDHKMGSSFTSEGMKEFLRLISWCLHPSGERRPPMNYVGLELERIHDKEMSLTTIMGEGTTTVTLGSQLFTS
ncbi:probable serine/threonine-protein kinase PBL21 [Asparagus officinalis]|uniref:probable serine/threonine-protein kinase PBL21 n=1 Tax=Asparagus officinalis TaxID=4686 RepID=UPI00098E20C4|nr:probable serine/threonine-protein kinase PBL21 [Asparagus officinalis]